MKRNVNVMLFILGLAAAGLLIVNCGKSGHESQLKVAEQLYEFLNKQQLQPGSQFKTNLSNSIVKPAENNRYWVTFKNSFFTSDFFWTFKPFIKNDPMDGNSRLVDTFQVKEIVMLYHPGKKHISFMSMKDITLDYDFSGLLKKKEPLIIWGLKTKWIHISIEKMTGHNRDINDMLKTGKENGLPVDFIMENLTIEFNGIVDKEETLLIVLEIKKIKNLRDGHHDQDVLKYMANKDAPIPDLSKTLQKGLAVNDFKLESGMIKVKINKNGSQWGSGTVKNISFSFFIKPDETRNSFKLGIGFGIKDLKLSLPVRKEIQLISNIKELEFMFFVEHLSSEAVMAIIDIIKESAHLRDVAGNLKVQNIQFQIMKFMAEMIKSKPQLKVSISPLKHYFGELSSEIEVSRKDLFSPPAVKARVDILKTDDILKKLEESHLFSPAELKNIWEILDKNMVKHENGDASMTFELKPHQPGKYFLNGEPKMMPLN